MNPFSLEGKNIVITGASSGIGRQCAINISEMGARVILVARNISRLAETVDMMANKSIHLTYSTDLTDNDAIEILVKDIRKKIGKIDGIVNCAGISMVQPFKFCSTEKAREIFDANVFSAFNLTRELTSIKSFSKDGGSVIFLASVMGCVGESGKSLYSMAKGALISGVRSLAVELANRKIRVNAISPGVIVTPINENLPHIADPEKRKITESKHLLGLGLPVDVAYGCVYLLSDASRWVTGSNLIIDGGYTVR